MNRTKFSLTLKQIRMNAGLTQQQVADALNLERSTYAYYETGATRPICEIIIRLSQIFNVDYKVFMEAIADSTIDDDYTTFSPTSYKKREEIYTITNDEQNLLILYRMLTPKQKKEVFDIINSMSKSVGKPVK